MIHRILIVGLGSIGRRHLRIARELFVNADIRVLRHHASNDVPKYSNGCFSKIEEAIAFAPQIAIIANPAPFHIGTAQALAEVGVHLLIEKPLSASTSGVNKLLETCDRRSLVLQTGYNLRFLTSLQDYRELLRKHVIGKILSVRCEAGQYLPSWRPESDYRSSVSARSELGGGALLEYSHEIDYLRWIFGEIDWVTATLSRQSGLEINVEDAAHITIGFEIEPDGYQLIGVVNLDLIRHDTTRQCTAIGENGSLRWNGLTGEIMLYEIKTNAWHTVSNNPHQRDDSYVAEWQNFIKCLESGEKPFVTGRDGLQVLQIINAVRNSAALKGKISYVDKTYLT